MTDEKIPDMNSDAEKGSVAAASAEGRESPVPGSPAPPMKDEEKGAQGGDQNESTNTGPRRPPPIKTPAPVVKTTVLVLPKPAVPLKSAGSSIAPRPMTSSSRRLSWGSVSSSKRRIKYGRGKYANTELVPQPSDDTEDPLNWPTWRKELNFFALLTSVALVGVMKTVFITVNGVLALNYSVSYTAVTALTGVPLMLSAVTGLASLTAARFWGKRPVFLVSMASIFIGSMWNMRVANSYAQCMAARVFQGLGWGAFDTLVLGSLHDTFFEHERHMKVGIYQIVSVATTWGGPLLGGVVSRHREGFSLQFVVLNAFLAVAVLLLVFGAPETAFDRSNMVTQTPATAWSMKRLPLVPRGTITKQRVMEYIKDVAPPYSFSGPPLELTTALQAPRALIAPTTVLLFLISFLPYSTLWGLASSLSLLFEPMPFMLSSSSISALLVAPFILSVGAVAGLALLPVWHRSFVPKMNTTAIGAGSLLFFIGLLTFGLYTSDCMTASAETASMFRIDGAGSHLSFPAVGFVLGLLAGGVYVLDGTVRPLIKRSTQFTSSNLAVALRNTEDMDAGVDIWRTLFAGVFVIALPNAVWLWNGVRAAGIGISVAQVVLAMVISAVWHLYDESLRRVDGRVMRCVDLALLKRTDSYFDMD